MNADALTRGTRHATKTNWIEYATPYARLIMSIAKKTDRFKAKTQWYIKIRKDSLASICRNLNDRDRGVLLMLLTQNNLVSLDDKKAAMALMVDVRKWRAARAELLAQGIIRKTASGYELSAHVHAENPIDFAETSPRLRREVGGDFSENAGNSRDLHLSGYGYGYGYRSKSTRIRKVMEDTGVDPSAPDRQTTDDILIAFDELDEVPQ